jgi:beta-N-acetylhexosaminidase
VEGKSVSQVRQEIDSLQSIRNEQGLPRLWIATDQEGGIVCRLSPPLTRLPALSEIVERHAGERERQQAVREFGLTQGHELARIGVNLNFAPVVDLNYQVINPKDRYTRIFQRAIARDPIVVAQVASWYCAALEQAGVMCTLKHFPGLGRVFEDTHLDPANLDTSIPELDKSDWVPFHALMRLSRAFVMLGHVRLTAIDPDQPVSLSSPVIAGMLRGAWKYDGVLITDNFSMMAVYRSRAGMDRGSIDALNAGVDLILVSYDPDQCYRVMYALLKADEQGKLDQEALKRSEQRLARALN